MRGFLVLALCAAVSHAAEVQMIKPTATSSFVVATLATTPGAEPAVWVRHNGETGWRPAVPGAMLLAGSSVMTEPGSSCQLQIGSRAWVHLEPGGLVTLPYSSDNVAPCYRVAVERGTAWSTVAKGLRAPYFQVESRHAVGRVRGTQFKTTVSAVDTRWQLLEGRLGVTQLPGGSERTLNAGTEAIVASQSAGGSSFRTLAFSGGPAAGEQFASNFGAQLPDPGAASEDIKSPADVKVLPFIGQPPKGPPFKLPPGSTGVRVPPATIKLPPVKLPPGAGGVSAVSGVGSKGPGAGAGKTLPFAPGTRAGSRDGFPNKIESGGGVSAVKPGVPARGPISIGRGAPSDRFGTDRRGASGFDRRLVGPGLIQVGEVGRPARAPLTPIRDLQPGRGFPQDFRRPVTPMRDFDRRLGGLDRPTGVNKLGSPVRMGR